jgi:uncharacterized protein (UPF0548 family)
MNPPDRHDPIYRWARGFSESELERELGRLPERASTGPSSESEAARDPSWHHYYSEALIAREAPGVPEPGGPFERARQGIAEYAFSDPHIVQAHFDHGRPLQGRPMLLELKILGLHLLCGVVVRAVRDEQSSASTTWGFRYDTLEGHVEAGAEWFLLSKVHATGEVRFRIQAAWHAGTLPNWWTRIGFHLLSRRYQRAWHRAAHSRLRTLVDARDLPPLPHASVILQAWQPSVAPVIREQES